LVPGNDGELMGREIAFDHVEIGATDAAREDANAHLAQAGLGIGKVAQVKRGRRDGRLRVDDGGFHGRVASSASRASTSTPSARIMPLALTSVSSYSPAGVESATTPPPA